MQEITKKIAAKIHDAKIVNIKFKLGIDAFISDDICICFDIEQDTIGLNIKEKSYICKIYN